MKKVVFLSVALLMVTLSFSQITQLSENTVSSPKFMGENGWSYTSDEFSSPICQFMVEQLQSELIEAEGIVNVEFTVHKDGSVDQFKVQNTTQSDVDQKILACLQKSSGQWQPGMVNGEATEMQRSIKVCFYNPENGTLNEQGNEQLQLAIKKYHDALIAKNNLHIPNRKAEKRANNRLQAALSMLDTAERFIPNEPSVAFWQACTYEQIGNELKKDQKLNEYLSLIEPSYQAQAEVVSIPLQ